MTRIASFLFHGALALALCAAAGSTQARNDKLLLPIDAALRSFAARAVLAPDIALRFGKASAEAAEVIAAVEIHSVVDPFSGPGSSNRRYQRPDEEVCLDAFRKAIAQLQQRARASGASAVVGIVS